MVQRSAATHHLGIPLSGRNVGQLSLKSIDPGSRVFRHEAGEPAASERVTLQVLLDERAIADVGEKARSGNLLFYRQPKGEEGAHSSALNAIFWDDPTIDPTVPHDKFYSVQLFVPDSLFDAIVRAMVAPTCRLLFEFEIPELGEGEGFEVLYGRGMLGIGGWSVGITHAEG